MPKPSEPGPPGVPDYGTALGSPAPGRNVTALRAFIFSGTPVSEFLPRRAFRGTDNFRTQLNSGAEIFLNRKRGWDKIYVGSSIAYNREVYFDRDTGERRKTRISRTDLADRNTYVRYGLEAKLDVTSTPVKYQVAAKIRKYDYEEVGVISSLDYLWYSVGASAAYELFDRTRVKLGYEYFVRDFDSLKARDRAGDLTDEGRKLTYQNIKMELRRELTASWTVYLDYSLLRRFDPFVGYYDYDRHRYKVRSRMRDRADRELRMNIAYWTRDYPRGYIFDITPTSDEVVRERIEFEPERKSYGTWQVEVEGEWPLSRLCRLWGAYEFTDQDSADPRYDYQRHRIMAGVKVEM